MSDDIRSKLPPNPAKRLPLRRVEGGIHSAEAAECVARKIPFVTRVTDWECLKWDVDYLKNAIGDLPYPLVRVADGQPVDATVADFLELSKDPFWRQKVMPPGGGGPAFTLQDAMAGPNEKWAMLAKHYELPAFLPKNFNANILIRGAGMGGKDVLFQTPPHWEYNAFAALFLQIRGRKTVWLFGPEESQHMGMRSELGEGFPFLTVGANACMEPEKYPELANATCYEQVLEPGDLLYWPEYWFHWFTHYPEYQMNFRIFFPADPHVLNPLSAAWAFSNALAEALGGFGNVEQAFGALPEETRALLMQIEENLLRNPGNVDSMHVLHRRFDKSYLAKVDERMRAHYKANAGADHVTPVTPDTAATGTT